MRVFLTGGTGTIGRAIVAALLRRGDEVTVLTRDREKAAFPPEVTLIEGAPCYEGDWQKSIAGHDAVINLAGEPLDSERWTAIFRQKLHDSRVDTTRFVAEAIVNAPSDMRPKALLSASGVDYYGFAEVEAFDDDEIDESDPGGESYLAGLCWDWEDETRICSDLKVRVALMRTGVVLSNRGALPSLVAPFKKHCGGPIGTGRQWMSWIHIDDVAHAYLHILDSEVSGAVNIVAPVNIRNSDFAKVLGSVLGRHSWFRVPSFVIMKLIGQLGEYVLKGRRTVPAALLKSGYEFRHPELEPALRDLL
ncbi:MAG: TIGR01777 family protein [Myxococcales bacterium]|nr:TIGR01777 family protein [Myxococcales bacterium]